MKSYRIKGNLTITNALTAGIHNKEDLSNWAKNKNNNCQIWINVTNLVNQPEVEATDLQLTLMQFKSIILNYDNILIQKQLVLE